MNRQKILRLAAAACLVPLLLAFGFRKPDTSSVHQKLYSFGLMSDLHVFSVESSWGGNSKFDKALSYHEKEDCEFVVHCGDMTQTGFYLDSAPDIFDPSQFAVYKSIRDRHKIPVYGICGNHESYVHPITENLEELKAYTGNDLYYAVEQGEDLFLCIGQPNWGEVMSEDALRWLQQTLEENCNRRCFVFIHSYMEEDSGDPMDLRENAIFDMWGEVRTQSFLNVMRHYKNTILFHGHSHMKFEHQAVDPNANYTQRNGFKSVHVPSVGKPRDIDAAAGTTPEDFGGSQGYTVDVYDDCIVLNGVDYVAKTRVPLGVYKIDTTLVKVLPGTFLDSTGFLAP